MSYKIIDYEGETVADDFNTATDAYIVMNTLFTKTHIKNMGLRVVKQEDNKKWHLLKEKRKKHLRKKKRSL